MNRFVSRWFVWLALVASMRVCKAEPPASPLRIVNPSWGDITLVYGPGVDVAMDSPEGMSRLFAHWQKRGFRGVHLRSDLQQYPPGFVRRHGGRTQPDPRLAVFWKTIDDMMERFDPHVSARNAASEQGFDYWIYHPHVYSEGAPVTAGVPGPGRMVPWSYEHGYLADHPEVVTVDRKGNKYWMVPEYAYPGMRAAKARELAHLAKTYRPKGILFCMRSEASQLQPAADQADRYGFNQPVAEEMQRRHGVDILTDPRFDVDHPDFRSDDPLVQKWRDLRGSYVTQLYREVRQAIREVDPKIQLAVTFSGKSVGPPLGNWTLEWQKWIDEGLIDVLVASMTFEASYDPDAGKKGYLTNVRQGEGTVPFAELRKYIDQSPHPEIQLISTGAPSYLYTPPPDGAHGWRCDVWYDVYTLGVFQRWQQWQADLAEFGHIKFLKQDFDSFKVRDTGASGGIGDARHHPELRSTPGCWYILGDGTDDRPFIQDQVHAGDAGHAVALSGREIQGWHNSAPDRSSYAFCLDNAIANGRAEMECKLYRSSAAPGMTVGLMSLSIQEPDVAVRIAPQTGRLEYHDGTAFQPSKEVFPAGQWETLVLQLDVDHLTWSAFVGADRRVICQRIPYAPAKERFVQLAGIETQFKVPSYRFFNTLRFAPHAAEKSPIYLDDVEWRWTPSLHYAKPGKRVLFADDFEQHPADTAIAGRTSRNGGSWQEDASQSKSLWTIERTTSYGPGVNCLRTAGGADLMSDLNGMSEVNSLTLDLDIFVRSRRGFPYILPDLSVRTTDDVAISLESKSEIPVTWSGVRIIDGTWRIFDGVEYRDTKHPVHYDVWNHLQLSWNRDKSVWRLVVQPLGELPSLAGEVTARHMIPGKTRGRLRLHAADPQGPGHASCFDNLAVHAE